MNNVGSNIYEYYFMYSYAIGIFVFIIYKMTKYLKPEQLEKVAFILKTIAHPLRIGITELLTINEKLSVSEICEKLNSEQSLTSHHLNNMKLKGILGSKREGQNIYYYLLLKDVTKVVDCMRNCPIV